MTRQDEQKYILITGKNCTVKVIIWSNIPRKIYDFAVFDNNNTQEKCLYISYLNNNLIWIYQDKKIDIEVLSEAIEIIKKYLKEKNVL